MIQAILKGKYGMRGGGGVQICEGGSISARDRDDVSSHLMYYQLFSEILEYELILFRSSHFDYDMEKS